MKNDQEKLKRIATICAAELCATHVFLFGSRARGDHVCDSDYDVIAIIDDDADDDIDDPRSVYSVSQKCGDDVDLMTSRHADFMSAQDSVTTLAYQISREGVLIYDRDLDSRGGEGL